MCVCVCVCVLPPLLVEKAGEGLAVDLFGEVILPPQHTVFVLLVVPLTGGDVRTLGRRETRRLYCDISSRSIDLLILELSTA